MYRGLHTNLKAWPAYIVFTLSYEITTALVGKGEQFAICHATNRCNRINSLVVVAKSVP